MRRGAALRWVALALAGILIAAAVAVAGSMLASRQIGLASEPFSAGDALAPPSSLPVRKPRRPDRETAPKIPTAPQTAPPERRPEATIPAGPNGQGSDGGEPDAGDGDRDD